MVNNTERFECGYVYHIYSHAVGKDLIFREDENYQYFLNKLLKYIIPVADIYAYCLLPNHFHLLLRFKDVNENEHKYLMKPFSNLLNAYAKAYNKRYNRKGALFLDFLKRKKLIMKSI
ncbi:MAG: transposase [Chryseobacterium sp.]|uniref:transposase n=1 Tax=Chryseobacterium sp. TaxID=1871047 RepID=UPI0025BEC3BB|nr:transposase [Chryseobacterium sp.]MCJ7934603.1 transposase [Chryseobacterium sp.]